MAPIVGFVLAAGLGTRIGALSRFRPKPLLPVGLSTPFARAAASLRAGGAFRVVANAAHLAEQVVACGKQLEVDVIVERQGPSGTAGGLAAVRDHVPRDAAVIVWNGDIVADIEVRTLIDPLQGDVVVVLAVRDFVERGKGNVGLDDAGRVVRLRDQSFGDLPAETRGAWFAAVHVLSPDVVARVPPRGCLVTDVLLPLLAGGARIVAIETWGAWHDVGDLPSYLAANVASSNGALVGDHVELPTNVTLLDAVVGDRARVAGAGALREVVVWPGAMAVAPLERVVVAEGSELIAIGPA